MRNIDSTRLLNSNIDIKTTNKKRINLSLFLSLFLIYDLFFKVHLKYV
jgi:hypothetical protein